MEESRQLEEKFEGMLKNLQALKGVVVAFSGGVDSSLVAATAKKALGDRVLAVTADSSTLPPGELEEARKVAEALGIRHRVVKVDELDDPRFAANPPNRCYYCKKQLLEALKKIAREEGLDAVVDGTNAEDLQGHRPGALALREEGVRSPLAEAGITKREVYLLAEMLRLPTAGKPSMACLSSRFPYGERITAEGLRRVAEAEVFIKKTVGVKQLRVRDHQGIARIEVGKEERRLFFDEALMDRVAEGLRKLGYRYVALDLTGYRTGSMDEALNPSR
ncbi:ATP-dependent sacrificial sulfur transferase LarE [Candidatus Hecatella orcuttiae]|jgi:uncharacterized protein|uniref:ATP-dependent sacrificial sulfur transferase LarE n=1 Tax=Candidatus Hecatella orcuttiae TaxID=1935119 RepID=UPI002867B52B|nr:ATP-dependent sacrificial sulfur transferase LarE [Candidatus Hecatella orcuttiae]